MPRTSKWSVPITSESLLLLPTHGAGEPKKEYFQAGHFPLLGSLKLYVHTPLAPMFIMHVRSEPAIVRQAFDRLSITVDGVN